MTSSRDALRYPRLIAWAGMTLLCVGLGWKVWSLLPRAYGLLSYPYELVYGEGTVLHESLLIKAGASIYLPPSPDQFIAGNYTPIYYWLNTLFVSASAPDFFAGRLISFAAGILIAVLIVAIVARSWKDLPAGLIAGLLFLCLTQVNQWFTFYKPDLLALLFTAAGVFLMTRRKPFVYFSVPLFLLAFYTKQSMVVAPLLAAAYLLVRDRDRRAVAYTAAMAIGVAVPFAILDLQTANGFAIHTIFFNRREWSLDLFTELVVRPALKYQYELIVAAGLIAVQAATKRISYPLLYLLGASLTLLAAGSAGSARNYTLEFGLASCVAVGLFLRGMWERRTWPAAALLLVAVLLLGLQTQAIYGMPQRLLGREVDNDQTNARMSGIAKLVRQAPDPVLSENVGLLVTNGRQAQFNDPFLMKQVAGSGLWDQTGLIQDIQQKKFPFLIMEEDVISDTGPQERWSPEVLAAIRANYKILYRDVMFVYVPAGN
ncbi:MAG: glycosyltransferase family 39 protein [Chloroflexi bacterium]|nr:glycosyltransferase family 39 protein [Chloroflexota bacterium]